MPPPRRAEEAHTHARSLVRGAPVRATILSDGTNLRYDRGAAGETGVGMKLPVSGLCSAIGAALLAWPASGSAHAIIIKSDPAAGGRVAGPVVHLHLQYNSRIDAERSRLVLDLPDGRSRALSVRAEASPDTLDADAAGLSPGAYRLHWQVLSVDGHITRGDIPFEVKPSDQ